MSDLESILLKYHANDLPKQQAMALIQDLIDAERITLRDEFAMHCPITWEEAQNYNDSGDDEINWYAGIRFEYADAMLERRKK